MHMHKNHLYNMMCQLVQEDKSLWRISDAYLKDAKGCKECTEFWKKMKGDKERHVEELTEMIRHHLT